MKVIDGKQICLAVLLSSLFFALTAQAAVPSSVEIAAAARKSDRNVRLRVDVTFAERTSRECRADLFGSVTTVGNDRRARGKKLATKIIDRRKTSTFFRALSPAVKYSGDAQAQLNLQVRLTCGRNHVDSNAVAENVTCSGGIKRRLFLSTLSTRFFR